MATSDTQTPRALNSAEREELVRRFFQSTSLAPDAIAGVDPRGPCLLAVSGGRDSMLLCYLMAALWQAGRLQYAPRVFHLDHGLRADSAADREFVGAAARVLDLPYSSTVRNVTAFARRTGVGLEAAGRMLRYRLLERLRAWAGGSWIVTAHHADDYVESLLAHLIRGGGPGALNTLPAFSVNAGVPLWRPLLEWDRAAIDAAILDFGIAYREDTSNASLEFLRNRLRAKVLPRLRDEGLDATRLWRNFHDAASEAPVTAGEPGENGSSALPEYLAVDRRLLPVGPAPLREWKVTLDLALSRLGCPPAERNLLVEIQRQLLSSAPAGQRGGGRLRYENRRVLMYADRRGPLWVFRREAAVLRKSATAVPVDIAGEAGADAGERVTGRRALRIAWGGREREYQLSEGESCGEWRPGLKACSNDGQRLAVNQLLREAGVPEPVRARLPVILAADGMARTLCLGFWEQLRDRHFPRV